jgi:hypothetical protein
VLLGDLAHNGLVDVRVERLAVRGDGQKTFLAEYVGELVPGSLNTLADVSPGLECAVQVIEDREKLLHQPL